MDDWKLSLCVILTTNIVGFCLFVCFLSFSLHIHLQCVLTRRCVSREQGAHAFVHRSPRCALHSERHIGRTPEIFSNEGTDFTLPLWGKLPNPSKLLSLYLQSCYNKWDNIRNVLSVMPGTLQLLINANFILPA